MQGLMMDMPLLVSSLLTHAARHFPDVEIVSRRVEGRHPPIHLVGLSPSAARNWPMH